MESGIVKPHIDVEKLERFNGLNYKWWSMEIYYQIIVLKVAYVLHNPYPQDCTGIVNGESTEQQHKWLEDDYVCHLTILQAMTNSLFNAFHKHSTALELWHAVEQRYVKEDAGNKSFLVNKYIDFKMSDSKLIIDQVNELNDIATECADADEPIFETFQVSTIIGKLPPSWKDYKKFLKHNKRSLKGDELMKHIQIEYEAQKRDGQEKSDNVNALEGPASFSKKPNHKFKKGQKRSSSMKGKNGKNLATFNKKKGPCFVCGKLGHVAMQCYHHKGKKICETNIITEDDMVAMHTELLVINNEEDWWLDSGATCHVTPFKSSFKTYEEMNGEKFIFMGNSSTCAVVGKGTVKLSLTSRKVLTLQDVYHILGLSKSLISIKKLDDHGFKVVFDSQKVIISKKGSFVGKGYATDNIHMGDDLRENASNQKGESNSSHMGHVPNQEYENKKEEEPELRSKRQRIDKDLGPGMFTYSLKEDLRNFNEAMALPDASLWKKAMDDEIKSIHDNNAWILVDLPPNTKPIGCKWVLRKKLKRDGSIDKYKARLVAKGFSQKEGLDYFEIFSPVTRFTFISIMFAIASIYNLEVHQMDVKTAFLNGELIL
ncbi:hypothetical protein SLEP1_g51101 [Rubroshorea leprosula]|uniref:CCHC-type domain-containing protein n=1 Tax=Rubroshorea leprosula TaxID=152421 RepID=A0AAV5M5D2_9ROSI|nr:hypothetical protein SLEP1_g51101 [Rubroshorea leprosula]